MKNNFTKVTRLLLLTVTLLSTITSYGKVHIFEAPVDLLERLSPEYDKTKHDPFDKSNPPFATLEPQLKPFPGIIDHEAIDLREPLTQTGVHFEKNDFAYYYYGQNFLLVKTDNTNIDILENLFSKLEPGPIELIYYQFTYQNWKEGKAEPIATVKSTCLSGHKSSISSNFLDAKLEGTSNPSDDTCYINFTVNGKQSLDQYSVINTAILLVSQPFVIGEWSDSNSGSKIQLVVEVDASKLDFLTKTDKEHQRICDAVETKLKAKVNTE